MKAFCDQEHLLLQSNAELRRYIDRLLSQIVGALWALLALTFLIASLGMVNTLTLNVMEQARELCVLRVLGMKRGQVVKVVLSQALLMSVAGLAPGTVVGLGLAHLLTSTGGSVSVQPSLFHGDAVLIAACWAVGLAAGALAAAVPACRASRLAIIGALRQP